MGIPNVPVIETERLLMRGHRLADLDASAAMWADPSVRRYTGVVPSTLLQSWARVRGYVGHWALLGFGYWVVEERATANFIGEAGFADFKRGVEQINGVPEIGWALIPAAHGNGYATEAVRAAIAWGDHNLESKRTVCMIDPQNLASLRVADKCGYREFARTVYNGDPTILFARSREI